MLTSKNFAVSHLTVDRNFQHYGEVKDKIFYKLECIGPMMSYTNDKPQIDICKVNKFQTMRDN